MSYHSTSSEYCPVQRGRGRSRRGGAGRGRRGGHQGPNRQEITPRARQERQTNIEKK